MRKSKTLELLRAFESRNVTFMEDDGSWPIVWERARGTSVWDERGRKYLDLTAAFGVAAVGHANSQVVRAGQLQLRKLPHAMGDVHPHPRKAELARLLSRITFERWKAGTAKTIFTNSGFEAVEAALKTAFLKTRRDHVIAFSGAYHGLGYGALNVTHREHFREPFRRQLREFASFLPYPAHGNEIVPLKSALRRLLRDSNAGAILVEPLQARGGMRIPPPDLLPMLRSVCDEHGALLILDEIYTGFGRTGYWFACEHSNVVPDIICLGKALTGGFPLSACVGAAALMDAAWTPSTGEAIHTSTFLGNPVGCAMALANIQEIQARKLVEASRVRGTELLHLLSGITSPKYSVQVRGLGLFAGLELTTHSGEPATTASIHLMKQLLARGFIVLPEGEHANVISFTPPLTITSAELRRTAKPLREEIARL